MRRVHGLASTRSLAGLLGAVLVTVLVTTLVAAVLPASAAAPIPARYLTLYRQAARTCPGLSWPVLAGIGTMESDNGRSRARGVHRGKNREGAEGPMQFEPATFAEYAVRADRAARLTPYDPADAVFTAARMLCADGAADGPQGLRRAVFAYNHACWYVRDVLALAGRYTHRPAWRHRYQRAAALCVDHHRSRGYVRSHKKRKAKRSHARHRRPRGHRAKGHRAKGHRAKGHRAKGHRPRGHRARGAGLKEAKVG
jgi:hypothetical protein